MNKIMAAAAIAAALCAGPALAQKNTKGVTTSAGEIVFYEGLHYSGDDVVLESKRTSVRLPFNIKSIGVHPGERWRICAKPKFREPCLTLDSSVPDAGELGIYGGIGSAEPIKD